MDHSNGIQLPPGLLPSVDVLTPGLVLLVKHPQVDRRYALEHIEDLDNALQGTSAYPNFTEKDYSTRPLDEALVDLKNRRSDAIYEGRAYFVLTSFFSPRMAALTSLVDSAFHYMPGINGALLIAAKVQGVSIVTTESKHLAVLTRKQQPKRESVHDEQEGITITVNGKIHSGGFIVSAVIQNALRDKWPHIDVVWDEQDNLQKVTQSILTEGRWDAIGAKSFKITNDTAVKKS